MEKDENFTDIIAGIFGDRIYLLTWMFLLVIDERSNRLKWRVNESELTEILKGRWNLLPIFDLRISRFVKMSLCCWYSIFKPNMLNKSVASMFVLIAFTSSLFMYLLNFFGLFFIFFLSRFSLVMFF